MTSVIDRELPAEKEDVTYVENEESMQGNEEAGLQAHEHVSKREKRLLLKQDLTLLPLLSGAYLFAYMVSPRSFTFQRVMLLTADRIAHKLEMLESWDYRKIYASPTDSISTAS